MDVGTEFHPLKSPPAVGGRGMQGLARRPMHVVGWNLPVRRGTRSDLSHTSFFPQIIDLQKILDKHAFELYGLMLLRDPHLDSGPSFDRQHDGGKIGALSAFVARELE